MYTITCDGNLLYDPRVDDLKVANAKLQLEVNRSGSFDFTIYPAHPLYGTIQKLKSVIEVYQDGVLLFRGRVLNDRVGLFLNKEIECEGDLAFFNDTIMRPFEYTGNLVGFIQSIIDSHNAQAGADKQFTLGNVTVTDPNDFITRSSIDYQTSWEVIENRLIQNLGGYIMVRRSGGVNYIDYLVDSNIQSLQELKLEENILDVIKDTRSDTIITALIPLGAKLTDENGNETDQRLTISSVNGGLDYVHDAAAVTQYGWIFGTRTWDAVTDANNLLTRANQELAVSINLGVSVELKAIDLSMIDTNIDEIRVFEYVQVTSEPHGINTMALITQLTINLLDPKQNTFTLGFSYDTFTEKQVLSDKAIRQIQSDYVTNQSIQEVRSSVQTVSSSITQQAEEIALKANQSTVDSLGTRVSTAESTITQQSEAIALRAMKTEVTQAIDDVQVGGRNYLIGYDGEENSVSNNTTSERYVYPSTNNTASIITLEPNTTYTMSAWFKTDVQTSRSLDMFFVHSPSSGAVQHKFKTNISLTTEYVKHTFTFTTGDNPDQRGNVRFDLNGSTETNTVTMFMKLAKLEKGNKATDWTPAPEDIDQAIGAVATRISSAEQKITPTAITSTVRSSTEYTNDLGGKVGTNEIVSRINQTAEQVKIQASKISLEGLVTVNSRFKILADGSMEATNGIFSGNITADSGSIGRFAISGQDLVYTSELFEKDYDRSDVVKLQRILAGIIPATSYDLWVYDTNSSGTLTTTDLVQINNFVESGTALPTPRKRIRSIVRIGTNNGAITTQAVAENGAVGPTTTIRGEKVNTDLVNTKSLATNSLSLNGETVVGVVVDSGSNSNGRYIRFSDGTQICWFNDTRSINASTTTGTQTRWNSKAFTFPAAFNAVPVITSDAFRNGGSLGWAALQERSATGCSVYILSDFTTQSLLSYMAIGTWR